MVFLFFHAFYWFFFFFFFFFFFPSLSFYASAFALSFDYAPPASRYVRALSHVISIYAERLLAAIDLIPAVSQTADTELHDDIS
jgi:hypothetical protein